MKRKEIKHNVKRTTESQHKKQRRSRNMKRERKKFRGKMKRAPTMTRPCLKRKTVKRKKTQWPERSFSSLWESL